jgi:hypothetical protein
MVGNVKPEPYHDLGHDDWWHSQTLPSDADLEPGQPLLTAEQIARFRNDGFLVVTGLWPNALVDRAVAKALPGELTIYKPSEFNPPHVAVRSFLSTFSWRCHPTVIIHVKTYR